MAVFSINGPALKKEYTLSPPIISFIVSSSPIKAAALPIKIEDKKVKTSSSREIPCGYRDPTSTVEEAGAGQTITNIGTRLTWLPYHDNTTWLPFGLRWKTDPTEEVARGPPRL